MGWPDPIVVTVLLAEFWVKWLLSCPSSPEELLQLRVGVQGLGTAESSKGLTGCLHREEHRQAGKGEESSSQCSCNDR